MMQLPPFSILVDMLAVLALSTAVVGHLQASQQSSILDTYTGIHIHDTAGPITINFYPLPLPPLRPVELSNAQFESLLMFNIIVGTLLVCLMLHTISHWPSNCITTSTQAKSGPPAGRSSAVPDWSEFKVASPARM